MDGKQSFNAVHKTVHLVKFQNRQGLLNFFFRVLIVRYLVPQDIVLYGTPGMVPTWPHNNSTDLYNFRFVLVCFSV